jgi:hypothetical protein
MVAFDEHGILIINGWTVGVSHDDMKTYLRDYLRGDRLARLSPGSGFYVDHSGTKPFDRNGVLTHGGAKMAFHEAEFDRVVNWLVGQYGGDLSPKIPSPTPVKPSFVSKLSLWLCDFLKRIYGGLADIFGKRRADRAITKVAGEQLLVRVDDRESELVERNPKVIG